MTLRDRWTESEHSVEGPVYRIRLCRPEKMNALTPQLYGEIRAGVLAGMGLPEVRAILIEGVGRCLRCGRGPQNLSCVVGTAS